MNLKIIQTNKLKNLEDFISFWSKQYYYPKFEKKYNSNIGKGQFETKDIIVLYEWKNGMRLSKQKQKSIELKIISKLDTINTLKQNKVLDEVFFKTTFKNLSAVWKIFLLHIIKPIHYPIYDQHIHRAYLYIQHLEWQNISNNLSDKKKENFYFEVYLPFVQSTGIKDIKKLDEAFFAFGQFINTKNYSLLLK